MTDDELVDAGLFDPAVDNPLRADLLRRCLELGLTIDEIREAGDDLVRRAIDAIFWEGREQLTLAEVAAKAGIDGDTFTAIAWASGFGGANKDRRVWTDDDIAWLEAVVGGRELLGEEAVSRMLRVTTAAVDRIADAAISTFLTTAAAPARAEDDTGLGLLEANVGGVVLLQQLGQWLPSALTRQMRVSFRDSTDSEMATAFTDGIDTPVLAIGFADLVGSTMHAERRTLLELNASLERFEVTAGKVVSAHGGRVVKFIGDEVMFRADDADLAATIALDLVDVVRADPGLPPLRAGVVRGMVLSREGDYYGPTVNLAARILKLAPMNGVVAPLVTADAIDPDSGIEVDPLGAVEMPGMAEPIELAALRRR